MKLKEQQQNINFETLGTLENPLKTPIPDIKVLRKQIAKAKYQM